MAATAAVPTCACIVSDSDYKVKCTACGCPIYIPEQGQVVSCEQHGKTRRGVDPECCGYYHCHNQMCQCACYDDHVCSDDSDDSEDETNKLGPLDTGECDCSKSTCAHCGHLLFIIDVGVAKCDEHKRSTKLRQGRACDACNTHVCDRDTCKCKCDAGKEEKQKVVKAEPPSKQQRSRSRNRTAPRKRSFHVPLKADGTGRPERKVIPCTCLDAACFGCDAPLYIPLSGACKNKHPGLKAGTSCSECDALVCEKGDCKCECPEYNCSGLCEEDLCIDCNAGLYVPHPAEGDCGYSHGTLRAGERCDGCGKAMCNDPDASCECPCTKRKCTCIMFDCGHCQNDYFARTGEGCSVSHRELWTPIERPKVCGKCHMITCGTCSTVACPGSGTPFTTVQKGREIINEISKARMDQKAKADLAAHDKARAASTKDKLSKVAASQAGGAKEKKKAAATKVVNLDAGSDTESDTEQRKGEVKAKAEVHTKAKAASPPSPAAAPAAKKQAATAASVKMSADELSQLKQRVEARKRKIADMQRKSADETKARVDADRAKKAKKAKLALARPCVHRACTGPVCKERLKLTETSDAESENVDA